MALLKELFANKILLACLCSWFTAQALKFVIVLATESRIDFGRMVESGGMPSSHSSLVCTLVTCVGRALGTGSIDFVICLVLAVIVMYDASGIRRAAGQHAAVLNKLINGFTHGTDDFDNIELKELLGHTPLQVFCGALLGIAIGFLFEL